MKDDDSDLVGLGSSRTSEGGSVDLSITASDLTGGQRVVGTVGVVLAPHDVPEPSSDTRLVHILKLRLEGIIG